jgi:hypothetical protein
VDRVVAALVISGDKDRDVVPLFIIAPDGSFISCSIVRPICILDLFVREREGVIFSACPTWVDVGMTPRAISEMEAVASMVK